MVFLNKMSFWHLFEMWSGWHTVKKVKDRNRHAQSLMCNKTFWSTYRFWFITHDCSIVALPYPRPFQRADRLYMSRLLWLLSWMNSIQLQCGRMPRALMIATVYPELTKQFTKTIKKNINVDATTIFCFERSECFIFRDTFNWSMLNWFIAFNLSDSKVN